MTNEGLVGNKLALGVMPPLPRLKTEELLCEGAVVTVGMRPCEAHEIKDALSRNGFFSGGTAGEVSITKERR